MEPAINTSYGRNPGSKATLSARLSLLSRRPSQEKVGFIPHRCKGCWVIGTVGDRNS
jgi:hypothetical protein